MARGRLRVYLGAAPGVGKTYAMLDEGWRRRDRGADVVIGVVETHGRPRTTAQLRDLEIVPRQSIEYRGTTIEEMDLDAVRRRRPDVVLVDELAHTNAPGSRHAKRWQDVELLLDDGIDVISTVNVQHLESLNDVVEIITGIAQRETVPDDVVRRADQIELVDMSPEALRRRLAHGNVYPAERVDAALRNYFREGNLAALRELALLWVADRVEDGLDGYRKRHGITEPWETRERVVVAVSGAPGGDRLIRRAARIARRARGELVGVHVTAADGLRTGTGDGRAELDRHRALVAELGGRYHEISGDDVAGALTEFARAQGATQLVVGAPRADGRGHARRGGALLARVVVEASGIDVHVIAAEGDATRPARRRARPEVAALAPPRVLAAWSIVVLGLPGLIWLLTLHRSSLTLATQLLVTLCLVVASAAMGGLVPGVAAAVAGSLLVNWYLVPPLHTFTIGHAEDAVSLVVFVAVAAVVSGYVHLAARRTAESERSRADAEALSRTTAMLLSSPDPVPELIDRLRATFRLEGLSLLARTSSGWELVAGSGSPAIVPTDGCSFPVASDGSTVLVTAGRVLSAREQTALLGHAGQLYLGLTARERTQETERAAALEHVDELRTAMLHSVSHDLRTPLAGIKAAVTSLLSSDIEWGDDAEHEFLTTVDQQADRMNRLVENLLDMSRLEAGALTVRLHAQGIGEVVTAALGSLGEPTDRVSCATAADLPPACADGVLLERALANVIANALTWSPPGGRVRIEAELVGDDVAISVIDNGPGIPEERRAPALRPFQRFDDAGSPHGTGLGLAVASGFVQSMGGAFALDDTPGGGLTVTIRLPRADATGPD